MKIHRSTRAAAVCGGTVLAAVALVTSATSAQAHVTVKPESTAAGGFTQLVFRVPTESDTASTVKVQVTLPSAQPLLYVSTLPVPGWTAKVTDAPLAKPVVSYGTTLTKAPRTVTWTASPGAGIKPGEYQNFAVSAGPLPGGELVFPAVQTYSDGTTVRWVQRQAPGAAEPEHPAPVFTAVAAADDSHASPSPTAGMSAMDMTSSDDGGSVLGGVALAVGGLALVVALVALLRSRRTA